MKIESKSWQIYLLENREIGLLKFSIDKRLIEDLIKPNRLNPLIHIAVIMIAYFILESVIPFNSLAPWILSIIIISLARLVIYQPRITRQISLKTHCYLFFILTVFHAIVWSFGIVYFSNSIPYQYSVILIFIAGGLTASAVAFFHPSLVLYNSYASVLFGPIIINLFVKGDIFSTTIALTSFAFFIAMIFSAVSSNKKYRELQSVRSSLDKQADFIRNIYNAAKDISFITCDMSDENFRIISFSPGSELLFQFKSENAIEKSLKEIQSPESFARWKKLLAEIRGNSIPIKGELEIVRKYGGKITIMFSIYPLFGSSNQIQEALIVSSDITQRKQRELALKESEEKFRNIVEASPMGMFMYQLEPDGRLVLIDANQAADKILGIDNQKLLGKTIEEAFPGLAKTEIPEKYKLAAGKGEPFQTDQVMYKDDKIEGAFEIYSFQTSPDKMAVLFFDVTERKHAEEDKLNRLQRARRQQSAIARLALHKFTIGGDIEGAVRIITETAVDVLYVERASIWLLNNNRSELRCCDLYEASGKTHSERMNFNVKDYSSYFNALELSSTINAEEACIDPRTREFADEYFIPNGITSVLDAGIRVAGKVVGAVRLEHTGKSRKWTSDEIGFIREISNQMANAMVNDERKKANEILRQSEQKYRSLVESMLDGVGISDLNETILFINESGCKIFGYSRDDLIGLNLKDLIIKEDWEKTLNETLKRKFSEHSNYEVTIKRKDGQLRQISVSAMPLFDINGNVEGTVGVFSDITDVTKAEIEKKELRDKLSRAQRMESLGVLAGGVAHDLNNILGPLVGYPELIKMQLQADSPVIKHIMKIEDSAKRATDVVQDLLTMARRGRYEMVPVNLNKVINSYLCSPDFASIRQMFPLVRIQTDLDITIPTVHGSSSHLSKVIMNLVINGIEAIPDDGELTIKTKCKYIERLTGGFDNIDAGKYVMMTVSDTGTGIDSNGLKHLFEPFYSKKEMGRSGSGLGLAIVYGVVKDHNGYIDVKSEVNGGTEFIVYLPVVEQDVSEAAQVIDIRGNEKILIVDDIEEQRELVVTILSSLGYYVESVANGREAIKYLRENKCDVVILDMILEKDFDGLNTYQEIIKYYPGQKAVITSGFSETDRVREAEKLGVGMFLKKPYTMQKLGKAIREVLTQKPVTVQ